VAVIGNIRIPPYEEHFYADAVKDLKKRSPFRRAL
jgi:hypothetical protein